MNCQAGSKRTYALKHEQRTVSVLALSTSNKVILTRQYRPGPNKILDELAGGRVDANETPRQAAKRELIEETGYIPNKLISLGRVYECAYSTIARYAYVALNCEKHTTQKLDSYEYIEVCEKTIHEFVKQLNDGLCTDLEVGWMGLFKIGAIQLSSKICKIEALGE